MTANWLDPLNPETLTPEELPFPYNAALVIYQEIQAGIVDLEFIALRPLQQTDPDGSVGVFALDWMPGEHEMVSLGNAEPTTSTYLIGLHIFVKQANQEEGLLKHAILSKMVRAMLYRWSPLRVRLTALTETYLGMIERTQRYGVRQQRFMSSEVDGSAIFLSTIEFYVETEAVPA
jgi:hypothetical protein